MWQSRAVVGGGGWEIDREEAVRRQSHGLSCWNHTSYKTVSPNRREHVESVRQLVPRLEIGVKVGRN